MNLVATHPHTLREAEWTNLSWLQLACTSNMDRTHWNADDCTACSHSRVSVLILLCILFNWCLIFFLFLSSIWCVQTLICVCAYMREWEGEWKRETVTVSVNDYKRRTRTVCRCLSFIAWGGTMSWQGLIIKYCRTRDTKTQMRKNRQHFWKIEHKP